MGEWKSTLSYNGLYYRELERLTSATIKAQATNQLINVLMGKLADKLKAKAWFIPQYQLMTLQLQQNNMVNN